MTELEDRNETLNKLVWTAADEPEAQSSAGFGKNVQQQESEKV